ncbi:MAG: hypothetical protein ACK2US_11425, partial [Anaerolineae bacterium]
MKKHRVNNQRVADTVAGLAGCTADEFRIEAGNGTYCMTYQRCESDENCGPYHQCGVADALPFCA